MVFVNVSVAWGRVFSCGFNTIGSAVPICKIISLSEYIVQVSGEKVESVREEEWDQSVNTILRAIGAGRDGNLRKQIAQGCDPVRTCSR